jgi:thiol-disulfide isomerase/thioredoxin
MKRILLPATLLLALFACDSDGDGLSNGEEKDAGLDPDSADTDGDGIEDGAEEASGTDPLVADTDGDGLVDGAELSVGTDPLVADSDGDGLTDGREVSEVGSDATVSDTDGDGLADGEEVDGFGSDPTSTDSDEDGYGDADEVQAGSDPADDESKIYQGGWPYQPEKDSFDGPTLDEADNDIGELFARMVLQDQYGDAVDIYDFAGHGKPIVIDISAIWCPPCNGLSEWLEGDTDSYGFDSAWGNIDDMVNAGDMYWITILGEDRSGGTVSLSELEAWDDKYQNENIAVLAWSGDIDSEWSPDANGDIASRYVNYAWPSVYFMDENMEIIEGPDGSDSGHYEGLDAANDYNP